MNTSTKSDNTTYNEDIDRAWAACYPGLLTFARRLVYSSRMPLWRGQEEDIAIDIVQETGKRIVERLLKTKSGEADPVRSFESMVVVIARNYCKDLARRDRRMLRIDAVDTAVEHANQVDLAEVATERAYVESLFHEVAREVVKFPPKQRSALLTELANHMFFDKHLTPLQQAFQNVGIQLQEYRQPQSEPFKKSNNQSALLYHACRRIRRVMCEARASAEPVG